MVPRAGIEPALPKEPDFESGASTSSATPAFSVGAVYNSLKNRSTVFSHKNFVMIRGGYRSKKAMGYDTMLRLNMSGFECLCPINWRVFLRGVLHA